MTISAPLNCSKEHMFSIEVAEWPCPRSRFSSWVWSVSSWHSVRELRLYTGISWHRNAWCVGNSYIWL